MIDKVIATMPRKTQPSEHSLEKIKSNNSLGWKEDLILNNKSRLVFNFFPMFTWYTSLDMLCLSNDTMDSIYNTYSIFYYVVECFKKPNIDIKTSHFTILYLIIPGKLTLDSPGSPTIFPTSILPVHIQNSNWGPLTLLVYLLVL